MGEEGRHEQINSARTGANHSGLIYKGPELVTEISKALKACAS